MIWFLLLLIVVTGIFTLPQTHYLKRQRAANAPEYNRKPQAEVSGYAATSNKLTYYQLCIQMITTARAKAWAYLKCLGREVTRLLMVWCLLPLAVAACFSMVDVSPAELPVDYYGIGDTVLIER